MVEGHGVSGAVHVSVSGTSAQLLGPPKPLWIDTVHTASGRSDGRVTLSMYSLMSEVLRVMTRVGWPAGGVRLRLSAAW